MSCTLSSDTLKIEFAQLNDFKTLKYYPVYLCKNFCVNGFVYTLDSSMIGHSDMITAIEYCLKQWSDFTGLRLELEKDNSGKNIYLNKVSDFRFRNFISLDSISAIMVTSSSFTTGDNAPNKIIVRTNSSNISINKSLKFWYKPDGDKPNEYYDFISTFLHELGHVLNIGHDVHYEHGLKSLMYFGGGSSFESAPDRLNLLQWGDEAKNGVQYVIDKSKIQPLNEFANIKPLFSGNLPALSIAPIISPSKDTVLCAEKLASYTLKSNFISNNIWNTNQTTQSIVLTPPSFPGGQTESSSYYTVKQWNENCTVASKPSLPVKVTWKKYCLRPPGDDKFFDGDISTRFASELNSKLYPNPFTSGIEIDIKDVLQGELIINVFNSNGDIVINRTLSVESGSFHDFVSMDKYNSGIYTIKIQNGNKVNIQQIVKAE